MSAISCLHEPGIKVSKPALTRGACRPSQRCMRDWPWPPFHYPIFAADQDIR